MPKNYYFDMDGVLVIYDRDAYTGKNPLYLRPGSHYFRNLPPDRKALSLINSLWRRACHTGDRVSTLTSINMQWGIFNEHFHDKILWNYEWLPYLGIENILISVTTKRDVVEFIKGHTLTPDDVLIDDFNRNLNDWRAAGGTSVKYCNGINNPSSFDGPKIYRTDSLEQMLSVLDNLPAA